MPSISQARTYFWNIDPGYFKLKHGFKTILAIALSLWLVNDGTTVTKLMAGTASGFAMQGAVAKTWTRRFLQVMVLDCIYFLAFTLGLVVHDAPDLTAVTLVLLAFIANYMRRFNMEWSVAPLTVWTLCFLATILPVDDVHEAWRHLSAVLVGFAVSAGIILLIFPENYPRLFINNANRFFHLLGQGLQEMRAYLLMPPEAVDFSRLPFVVTRQGLTALLDSSQAMQLGMVLVKNERMIHTLLTGEYGLLHAYSQLIEAYHVLFINQYRLPLPARLAICHLTRQYAHFIADLEVGKQFDIVVLHQMSPIPNITKQLRDLPLVDPAIVTALLNMKLGFELLHYQLTKLDGGNNGN